MLLALGLKLLGIGKFLKDFFIQNWKWIVPIIALILVYFYIHHLINNAYKQGEAAEKHRWELKIEEENRQNREFEQKLSNVISEFGNKLAAQTAERVAKEQLHTNTIETIIRDNPIYTDCKVDQTIINERNAIRALGPEK